MRNPVCSVQFLSFPNDPSKWSDIIRARHLDLRELHGFDPPMDCFILRTFLSVITVTDRPRRRLSLKFFSSSMKRPDSVLPGTLDLNAFCHSKIRRLLKAI